MRAPRVPAAAALCAVLVLAAGSVAAAGEGGRASAERSGARIPGGVHEIDVTRGVSGKTPTVSVSVGDARKVTEIVGLIDSLPTVAPGVLPCPMIPTGAPRVSLTFRAKPHGAALAQASELALAFAGPCNPVTLRIGGASKTSLLAGSGFLTAVGKVVGRKLAASG